MNRLNSLFGSGVFGSGILILVLLLSISIILAVPTPRQVTGDVYGSDGESGTPVFLNLSDTNNTYRLETACFFEMCYYDDANINGSDGETIIGRAWNSTHYGENTTTLLGEFEVTYLDLHIDTLRGSEPNVSITIPANDSTRNLTQTFNVTANITMLGNDSLTCKATISFSNNSVMDITSGESASHSIGDITRGNSNITTWNITAKVKGVSNIIVNASCATDNVYLENLTFAYAENITVNAPPIDPFVSLVSYDQSNSSAGSLNCSAVINDYDGEALNVTVNWYRNDTFNITVNYNDNYVNGTNFTAWLDADNLSISDTWKCGMQLNDSDELSNWINSSGLTIIKNHNPNISFFSPTPTDGEVYNNTYAFINTSLNDSDSDLTYAFFNYNNSLIGWWRMDHVDARGEGSTVYDNSTYGNDGTANGNAAQTSQGRFRKAYEFDGAGDYIDCGNMNNALEAVNNFSISFWIKFNSTEITINEQIIDMTDDADIFSIYRGADDEDINFIVYADTNPTMTTTTTINDKGWHHIVAIFNSTNIMVYIDGSIDSTPESLTGNTTATSISNLDVGGESGGFNGSIDEVLIFNRSLGSDEIKALYNASMYNLSHNFTGLKTAYKSYTAYIVDRSGNVNLTTRTMIVDLPPEFNMNATNPASPAELQEVFIYANVTDDNNNISWVNFTLAAPNGTLMLNNENASSNTSQIWNSSLFNISAVGMWSWNISAGDGVSISKYSGSYTILGWHIIVGNLTGSLMVGDSTGNSLMTWNMSNVSNSNIYVADCDSSVNFNTLAAFARDIDGAYAADDFSEADILMNLTSLSDSINRTFTIGGDPLKLENFTIFGTNIINVSIINSTNSSNFITGILWDYGDDVDSDGGFDTTDIEDIIFVTKVNSNTAGRYGTYDYEIKIPAYLRKFNVSDTLTVSIYAEIR